MPTQTVMNDFGCFENNKAAVCKILTTMYINDYGMLLFYLLFSVHCMKVEEEEKKKRKKREEEEEETGES